MAKLTIIIVSWNTCGLLLQCLESVLKNTADIEPDIWVVDNASTDHTTEKIRDHFPQVHLIENSVNYGFARANNQAVGLAQTEYLLLLNPDTVIHPGSIDCLMKYIENQLIPGE